MTDKDYIDHAINSIIFHHKYDESYKITKDAEEKEEELFHGSIQFLKKLSVNKNDWHYVKSEEDLPKDNSEYLLLLEHGIRVFGYYNGKFWESWKGDLAWHEVKAYYDVPVPNEESFNLKGE
jgi:hypothetical protein